MYPKYDSDHIKRYSWWYPALYVDLYVALY